VARGFLEPGREVGIAGKQHPRPEHLQPVQHTAAVVASRLLDRRRRRAADAVERRELRERCVERALRTAESPDERAQSL
jgi:hypothetical protein